MARRSLTKEENAPELGETVKPEAKETVKLETNEAGVPETPETLLPEAGSEERRRALRLQELAARVLAMRPLGWDELCGALLAGGLDKAELSYAAGIVLAQAQRAMGGDLKAAEFLRELSGQKTGGSPVEELRPGVDLRGLSDAQLLAMINEAT
ncbi:MAG: hypothetical protein K6G17_01640 [Oscillospiraceae bacterium]|nr:hypothetical protein [Oscillospiraceae bacterium]